MVRILVQNAIQYTPDKGTIAVTLRCEAEHMVLEIQDTGIGIPLEDQSRVFDKFYRGENVREDYEGAGLGLAIIKSILDRHGGRIWVESQPGMGTRFTVLLPVQAEFSAMLQSVVIGAEAV
jgi:signal transduction histidine kinase